MYFPLCRHRIAAAAIAEHTDTDEIVPVDSGHYDYGVPTPKVAAHQPPLNTLNTINAVLLRKTALNKLSR